MTVYVDNMKAAFGRMVMCHAWGDTREELFEMMQTIGVQLKWFQRPDWPGEIKGMNASWEHFDISMTKRALAVATGAIEVDQYTMAEHANRQQFIRACERQQWAKAQLRLEQWLMIAERNSDDL